MRGIHAIEVDGDVLSGITPACAGNTNINIKSDIIIEDHPRVCGEYQEASSVEVREVGSPPRVRGIRDSRQIKAAL